MNNFSSSHASVLPTEDHWAAQMASRLRLLLAAGADEPAEQREAHIEEQVRRGLQSVPAAQRTQCLERLAAHFPVGQITVLANPPGTPDAAERKPQTPDEVMALVGEAWTRFTLEQRKTLRERFVSIGVIEAPVPVPAAAAASGEAVDLTEAKRTFGLTPTESMVPLRLGRLAAMQTDFYTKLDQLAWSTWKQVSPQSPLKKDSTQGDFRSQLRRYLKGDAEPTDMQIAQQIERTRQLVSSLVGSLAVTSRGFAKRYQTRYAPEAVRDIVKMEGGIGPFGGDAKCWKKYNELAAEINELSIQTDMMETISRFVEDMVKTRKTGAPN